MTESFPRELDAAFILGLINNKLKILYDFIPKLKSPLPRSDCFKQSIQCCKNTPNEMLIIPCADVEDCTSGNYTCDYCIDQGIKIQVVIDRLKVESFYDFLIKNHFKYNLHCGCVFAQYHLKVIFETWEIDHDEH